MYKTKINPSQSNGQFSVISTAKSLIPLENVVFIMYFIGQKESTIYLLISQRTIAQKFVSVSFFCSFLSWFSCILFLLRLKTHKSNKAYYSVTD